MTGRRGSGVPIISLLDLLIGLFGAMIVIAAVLSLLRLNEGVAPFLNVFVEIAPVGDAPDVSSFDVDFRVLFDGESGNGDLATTLVDHEPARTSAMLLVREEDVPEGRRARLGAHLPSIPSLFFEQDGWLPQETQVRIRVVIMSETGSCAGEVFPTLAELETYEQDSTHPRGPSLFGLMPDGVCGWEVTDGYVEL